MLATCIRRRVLLLPLAGRRCGSACTHEDGPLGPLDDPQQEMASHVKALLRLLGEDPNREGLLKTPKRVAKALTFLTSGMTQDLDTLVNNAVFEEQHDEMVIVRNIDVYSMCEHHMLPFYGVAHIAYLPHSNVIGLSKLGRITDLYARRLQVQERLTKEVANALMDTLQPRGVGVVIEATHMCMAMRGVQKTNATTVTSCMLGAFRDDPKTRNEFVSLLGMPPPQCGYQPTKPVAAAATSVLPETTTMFAPPVRETQQSQPVLRAPSCISIDSNHTTVLRLFKEAFKFSAGHFTIFGPGSRERLHGHNFGVEVALTAMVNQATGMIEDYNVFKSAVCNLCESLDEYVLLPGQSPLLCIQTVVQEEEGNEEQLRVAFARAKGGEDVFVFPSSDVLVLPLPNITLESLSRYLCTALLDKHGSRMADQGVSKVVVTVSSGPGQTAEYAADVVGAASGVVASGSCNRVRGASLPSTGGYSRGFSTLTCSAFRRGGIMWRSFGTNIATYSPSAVGRRLAVITGASSGIGLQTARLMASNGEWDHVHAISRRPCPVPGVVSHSGVDLSCRSELRQLSTKLLPLTRTLQALMEDGTDDTEGLLKLCVVHCAGVHPSDSVSDITLFGMEASLHVNVVAPALLTSLLLPHAGPGSSVIYIGSTLSEMAVAGRCSYVTSKHAVVGLMRSTVQDLFGTGVHTLCLCPGFTDTAMLMEALEGVGDIAKQEEIMTRIKGMVSFGRLVQPEEVAQMVQVLSASPAANGTIMHFNLGQRCT